jgi:hypothetical protein
MNFELIKKKADYGLWSFGDGDFASWYTELDNNIVTPVIYNQNKYHGYGIHRVTGEIYSKKSGAWRMMSFSVSSKSPYPQGYFSYNGVKKFIVQHIAVHETLNPTLPVPPGISNEDWKCTPASVKKMLRHVWQVNHIDHCHTNYNPNNLEWTTAQQNVEAYQAHRLKNAV